MALLWPSLLLAQYGDGHVESPSHEVAATETAHHGHSLAPGGGWEGSSAGIAYSEGNHHIAGFLVLFMGTAELGYAFRLVSLRWTRWLLPFAMLGTGLFLIIWSDHEAWPIGSLSLAQSFFGQSHEIIQHKIYGLLALVVGTVEFVRRSGWMGHAVWTTPLPLMAILGGLMLFGHSHGDHPSAHKIAMHHAVMGTMAITAGSSKLLSDWFGNTPRVIPSRWEVLWAGLILLIGVELLFYSE